ncbi:MAG: hypothetical protein ACI4EU_02930 [Butyrivibrio sp.]
MCKFCDEYKLWLKADKEECANSIYGVHLTRKSMENQKIIDGKHYNLKFCPLCGTRMEEIAI